MMTLKNLQANGGGFVKSPKSNDVIGVFYLLPSSSSKFASLEALSCSSRVHKFNDQLRGLGIKTDNFHAE